MAAPAEVTIKDLSGKWVMDKNVSTPADPVLNTQGVSWALRKTIGMITLTLDVKQTVEADGVTFIKIEQIGTGGFKGTTEERRLDCKLKEHVDSVFGTVNGCTRWINLDQINDPFPIEYQNTPEDIKFLTEDWIEDDCEKGGPNGEKHIDSFVRNEKRSWTARQIWGFSMIDNERHYVRRVVVKTLNGKTVHHVKLVYNWKP
ncbi:hypothetical protein GcM3_015022 [Golovinomyces cichoracearum]|uniref:LCCL domain-containing protein n=1 Tax=Golovinomyces cichoracearum TaxID=62708 RepID=A0A420J910_9PEZI|nr:hypothetical protein GcM3_015022 [Golovinomyces cichoracearum]